MPLNRYEDVNGHQEMITPSAGTPNSTLRSDAGYKMVVRALYNFQVRIDDNTYEIELTIIELMIQPQNHRELGFKKGDIIYVRRQVDANWLEGERNATLGIFPVSYVEVIPEAEVGSLRTNRRAVYSAATAGASSSMHSGQQEGQAKVKFNFHAQTPMELSLVKGRVLKVAAKPVPLSYDVLS